MATERRVSWIITANVKQWQKGLNKAQRRMDRFGRKMQRAGRSLTRNVTMPLVGAAGAAVKFASDFESSLSQAQAQADLTAKQVSFIGDSAKEMAQRTGESTDEIIEAYKFTISAGKNLAQSQEIVKAAAEASAAGFGEQRDLVRTATTALEAYSDRLDSGREFMDLLVGSAQVMELEVSKLSGAMQRNVGVADQLGIGLDELLSGIGAVSEIMGDAQRGGRLFQTMLTKLLSPTGEAKEAISGVFGSLSNMHQAIQEDGLLQTMLTLREELEATSEEGLGLVFSQRSLEAALNFTNNEGERTNEIMRNMGDTAGSTKSAFDSVADSTENNFRKALRSLQVSAIELGEVMLPIANKIIKNVQSMAKSFQTLSDEAKVNVVKVAGLFAAGGPLLLAFGTFVRAVGQMAKLVRIRFMLIIGVFTTTVTAGQWMVDNWDTFMDIMAQQVKSWAKATQNSISLVLKAISFFGRALPGIAGTQFEILDNMILQFQDLGEDASNNLTTFGESGKNAFDKIRKSASAMLGSLTSGTAMEDFMSFINGSFTPSVDTKDTEQESEGIGFAGVPDITKSVEDYAGNLDLAMAKGAEFSSVTEAALTNSSGFWDNFVEKSKAAGFDFVNFLTGQVSNAISSFAQNLGQMMAGAGNEFATGLQQIILVVVDFAKQLAQLLIGIGTAIAFVPGLQGPAGAYIAGGAALMALASGAGAAIQKNIDKRRERARETNVNDALVRSDGSIVNFHPDDDILAMKDFSKLGMAGGGSQTLHNNLFLDGTVVWRNQRRVNHKRRR